MLSFEVTYKTGVRIVTHPSGVVSVYVTDEIKEHKQEIQTRIAELQAEVLELDKQIVFCTGETLWAKVKHIFRRDIVT